MIVPTGTCPICGQPSSVKVPASIAGKVAAFRADQSTFGLVQEEFPWLPAGTRETILSGIHERCWDDLFGEDDL